MRTDDAALPAAGVTDAGVKVADTPDIVEADKLTASLKPLMEVTVIVEVAFSPMGSLMADGDAVNVKSGVDGAGGILRVMVVL